MKPWQPNKKIVFTLLTLLICFLSYQSKTHSLSLSDLKVDLFEEDKNSKNEKRNPFNPDAALNKVDIEQLSVQGIVIGPDVQYCLIAGSILKIGDIFGSFVVKNIDQTGVVLQSEAGLSKLNLTDFISHASSKSLYDIAFRNAGLKQALRMIAAAGKYNMIIPEASEGTVSLSLHQIPLKHALRSLLRVNGLEFAEENDIIRVGTKEDFVDANLVTRSFHLNYADAEVLLQSMKDHISTTGKISADARTNNIIIKDSQAVVDNIEKLIAKLDSKDTQIKIEAKIVDVTRNFSRSLGIRWSLDKDSGRVIGFGVDSAGDNMVNIPSADPTGGLGMVVGNVFGRGNVELSMQIDAAETRGDAHIISQPTITTVNNTPARIRSGLKIYVKSIATSGSTQEDSLEEIDTGIELNVTPQMTSSNRIKMTITAEESEADFSRTVDGVPAVIDNVASTTVLVKDGETTVIGGLLKIKKTSNKSGLPLFQHIPLFGWLFKGKTKTKTDNELLIFITPHIVQDKVAGPINNNYESVIKTEYTAKPVSKNDENNKGRALKNSKYSRE